MIEKLQKLLKSKFDYDLQDYAIYEIKRKQSKLFIVCAIIFLVPLLLYILDVTDVFNNFMNMAILIFSFIVLVIVPLALRKGSKYEAIIVTPLHLIQRTAKQEFQIVEFDKVEKFALTKEGIKVKGKRGTILLGLDLFREEIDPIIDILEAKGKTFDKEKEFMIRPIEIRIEDNKIIIVDLDEVETKEDLIYQKFAKDYDMLTPGFIKEIIFRNSMVSDSYVEDDNLIVKLNSFEVKGGHPENTTFDSLTAEDCIVVFEGVNVKQNMLQDLNKKDEPDKVLPLDLSIIPDYLETAVISHWKVSKTCIDLYFATGVNILKLCIDYKEVLIGWNKTK